MTGFSSPAKAGAQPCWKRVWVPAFAGKRT